MVDQLKRILASLSQRQKVTIAAALLALAGGLYWFARYRTEADFKPLVTGLAAEDSAAVVQKLKESGADYRLSDTGSVVSVPSAKLAEMRLELAAAGLPKTGRIGYEIFDKSNLGATDFVEHVNYRRALEGELERTLGGIAGVEQARVHLTFPKDSVFLDAREPAKASVVLKLRPEARLSPRNITAVGRLVSNAVEGLAPDAVSVVDAEGNLLSRPSKSADEEATEHAMECRQKVERNLTQKINDTLEPLLGHDHYKAGVSADCDLTSGEQSEETLDPTRSVMVSSAKTEDVTVGGTSAAGVPGTASNLPRPTTRPMSASASTTRRTENVNYESSRMIKKVKLAQGGIKRVSVAVLLDQTARWEGMGATAKRVFDPPSAETLKTVKDVVAAVVGFSAERGDQITVESLPFENTMKTPPPPGLIPAPPAAKPAAPTTNAPQTPQQTIDWKNWKDWKKNPMPLAIAGGALLLLVGGAAFLFLRKKRKKAAAEAAKALAEAERKALPAGTAAEQLQAQLAEQAKLQEAADLALLSSIKVPPVKTQKAEVLTKQLKENVKKDASASVQVIQGLLHDRG